MTQNGRPYGKQYPGNDARASSGGPSSSNAGGGAYGYADGYFQLWQQMTRDHLTRLDDIRARMSSTSYGYHDFTRDAFECWSSHVHDVMRMWGCPSPAQSICFQIAQNDENSDVREIAIPPGHTGTPTCTALRRDGGTEQIPADKVYLELRNPWLKVQIINLRVPPPSETANSPGTPLGMYRGTISIGSRMLSEICLQVDSE